MTSKKADETSSEEQDERTTDSVFDFLYHDGRRIASLLAQFDPSGHLTQLSQGKSASKGRDSSSSADGSASVPGIAKYENRNQETITRSHEEEVMRVYDPTWSNARTLLDVLDEKGLIQRQIEDAHIGQIVLVSGKLSILDLGMVQQMWRLDWVQSQIRQGAEQDASLEAPRAERRRAQKAKGKQAPTQEDSLIDALINMIQLMPHAIQANLVGDVRTWFTLQQSGLTSDPSELTLKHGSSIPGDWYALGFMDARPDSFSMNSAEQLPTGKTDDLVAGVAKSLVPVVRGFFGRPAEAFSITPLLIFRQVT